ISTNGKKTGMESAVMKCGSIVAVLLQGTSKESQISRFIEHYGQGVQHIALRVRDLSAVYESLKQVGFEFSTEIIEASDMRQACTKRHPATGLMIELIERGTFEGFDSKSVDRLFARMEESDEF